MITQEETKSNEKLEDFKQHKEYAKKIQELLSECYKTKKTTTPKAERIKKCGNSLELRHYFDENDTTKLHSANFCKHKLCPMCAWRWHIKQNAILKQTFKILGEQNYYHLTLTIPNCNTLTKEFLLTLKTKAVEFMRKIVKSNDYFINLEITIDENGKYHPHYHIVYIDYNDKPLTRKYIQTEWAKIANTGTKYAIAKQTQCTDFKVSQELTKYLLKFKSQDKDGNVIKPTQEQIKVLAYSTKGLRKFSTAGKIKIAEDEAKKILDKEKFDEMQTLKYYDSEILFYLWLNNSYTMQTVDYKEAEILKDQTSINIEDTTRPTNNFIDNDEMIDSFFEDMII